MVIKKKTIVSSTAWVCIGLILFLGCSHPLEVKNLDLYRTYGISSFQQPLKIGLVTDENRPEQKRLLDGVANALASYSANVMLPYQPNSNQPVDVMAYVDIEAEHEGSGWNFLINWPGFLIWTPAWHGYVYKVKYMINCTLTDGTSKETLSQFQIPVALDIRHARINRTWTEISWLEVSVIAFVGGLVFINYDESVTPLLGEKTENPIGKYIAQEIVKRVNASGTFTHIDEKNQDKVPGTQG